MFFKRQHRFGVLVLLWSSAWILFDYGIRPGLFGEGTDHARRVLGPLMEDPIGRLVFLLGEIEVQRLIAIAIPLAPLLLVTRREGVKFRYDILLLLVPLVGIRFLGGIWRHHYLAVMVPILLGALGPALEPSSRTNPASMNKGILWCLILLAITNADPIKKNVRTLAGTFGIGREAVQPERLVMIERGMNWLREHDGRALVQGNLLPRLVDRHEIYQVRGSRPRSVTSFEFVFVEKPPHGDPLPIKHQDYARLIERWRRNAEEIVIDDDHVFLARGSFGDRN